MLVAVLGVVKSFAVVLRPDEEYALAALRVVAFLVQVRSSGEGVPHVLCVAVGLAMLALVLETLLISLFSIDKASFSIVLVTF